MPKRKAEDDLNPIIKKLKLLDIEQTNPWEQLPTDMWYEIIPWIETREIYLTLLTMNKHLHSIGNKYIYLNSSLGFMHACALGLDKIVKIETCDSNSNGAKIKYKQHEELIATNMRNLGQLWIRTFPNCNVPSNATMPPEQQILQFYYSQSFVGSIFQDYIKTKNWINRFECGLISAIKHGQSEIVNLLMRDSRTDFKTVIEQEFAYACSSGYIETLKTIIELYQPSFETLHYSMCYTILSAKNKWRTPNLLNTTQPMPLYFLNKKKDVEAVIDLLLEQIAQSRKCEWSEIAESYIQHDLLNFLANNRFIGLMKKIVNGGVTILYSKFSIFFKYCCSYELIDFVDVLLGHTGISMRRKAKLVCMMLCNNSMSPERWIGLIGKNYDGLMNSIEFNIEYKYYLLFKSIERQNFEEVRQLLRMFGKDGIDLNHRDCECLKFCFEKKQMGILQLLIQYQPEVEQEIVKWAVEQGHTFIANHLWYNPTQDCGHFIKIMANHNYVEAVEALSTIIPLE